MHTNALLTREAVSLFALLDGHDDISIIPDAREVLSLGLRYAIQENDLDLCLRIVEIDADTGETIGGCGKCNSLIYAQQFGRKSIARMLLRNGASTTGITCDSHPTVGFDVAHHAVRLGDEEMLSLILSKRL